MSKELIDAMINMNEKEAVAIATDLLNEGEDPLKILDSCKDAMDTVGKRFESGEFFLPQLILAGEILRQVSEIIKPKLESETESKRLGKIIIATVEGRYS